MVRNSKSSIQLDSPGSNEPSHLRVDANLLIPGRGLPIHDASIVTSMGKIDYVGPSNALPLQYQDLMPEAVIPVLMPGMWDCHLHFFGSDKYRVDTNAATNPTIAGARSARDLAATLNAGVTSVREMAGYGLELSQAIGEGWLQGPNIYSAISMLSQTAGHGDARSMDAGVLCDKISHGLPFYVCDGIDECRKAVRVQIRRGAKVIKIAASGGVASLDDDISLQQFSNEEMEVMVKEAQRAKLIVGAHCHSKDGIMAALRAGCQTIEHGTYMDEDCVSLMLEKDAILVATRSTLEFALAHPEAWTEEMYKQMLSIGEQHLSAYRMAVKAGVRIALGTDLGVSSKETPWNHGMNGIEFKYAVKAGLSPLEAIEAGTANAPLTLGPQGPKSGLLTEGYDADFIGLKENPLEDISILAVPENIFYVWKAGRLCKAPGMPVGLLP